MYLSKRHVAENALIPLILQRLADGDHIETLINLPTTYGNKIDYVPLIVSAAALSMVNMATKKGASNPMVYLDLGKVADIVHQASTNAQTRNSYGSLPTLTTYNDKVRIKYDDQMNYKSARYCQHPIEKKLEMDKVNREIPTADHLAYVIEQLNEHGVRYHLDELEKEFSERKWSYRIAAVINDTDSRRTIDYHSYQGNLHLDGFDRANEFERQSPRLTALVREQMIERLKHEVSVQDVMDLAWPMHINLMFFRTTNSTTPQRMSINAILPIQMLSHSLRPAVEDLHVMSDLLVNPKEIDALEKSNDPGIVIKNLDAAIEQAIDKLVESVKGRATKARRRQRAAARLGDDALSIDKVAQALIMLVAKEDPKRAREIVIGTKKHYNFRKENGYVFIGNNRPHEGRASFQLKDGQLTTSFKMSDNQRWVNNGLMVDALPIIVAESIKGRLAQEVVEHPIADLLGPVKSVNTRGKRSAIRFASIFDPVERKDLLAQIPEG